MFLDSGYLGYFENIFRIQYGIYLQKWCFQLQVLCGFGLYMLLFIVILVCIVKVLLWDGFGCVVKFFVDILCVMLDFYIIDFFFFSQFKFWLKNICKYILIIKVLNLYVYLIVVNCIFCMKLYVFNGYFLWLQICIW